MAWTFPATGSNRYSLVGGGSTGSAVPVTINSSGCNLLVAIVGWYQGGGGVPTLVDSIGATNNGTPTQLTEYASANRHIKIFYWENPANVGASHTFTATPSGGTGNGQYINLDVFGINESNGAPTFDAGKDSGNSNNTGAAQTPGSLTPSVANCLFITGAESNGDTGPTGPPSGYTAGPHTYPGSGVFTTSLDSAYLAQSGGPTASNPSWDWHLPASEICVCMAVFKPAAGSTTTITPGAAALVLAGGQPSLSQFETARLQTHWDGIGFGQDHRWTSY